MPDLPTRAEGDTWLGPPERAQFAALTVEKRRLDWLLGRVTLKSLVRALIAERDGRVVDPTAIRIDRRPSGAPFVGLAVPDGPDGVDVRPLPVAVSISHSAGRALVAAAWTEEVEAAGWSVGVGADLEHIEPRSDLFVNDFLTAREQREWLLAPVPYRDTLANLLWSAKEAVAKVLQRGLRIDSRWVTCLPDTVPDLRVPPSLPFADHLVPDDHDWRRFAVEADPRLKADDAMLAGRWRTADGYVFTLAVGAWSPAPRS